MNRKFRENSKAISPVIGTILMVAITVIMAAIISSWSAGIKAPQSPKTIGVDLLRLNQTQIQITVSSINPPGTKVTYLNFTEPGYTNTTATTGTNVTMSMSGPDIGNTSTFNVSDYNVFVVGRVTYEDGTKKVIYSQKI